MPNILEFLGGIALGLVSGLAFITILAMLVYAIKELIKGILD